MPSRSNMSLASLLLTQRLVESPAAPLKASEYWSLLTTVPDPATLLGLDASAVSRLAGVDRLQGERIAQLLDAASAFAFELERAEESGLRVISSVDDDYPEALVDRLAASAPPLLYVAGDSRLLAADLLGVVGSRDVGDEGAEVARGAARTAAAHRFGVVSGGAKGVDRLAMGAALDAGGTVACVLADSLTRTTRDPDVRRGIVGGELCLCTPYKPSSGFSVANAMGRNKVIYALARVTLVVAADAETGGTWAGAIEALRQTISPVLVWTGPGAGSGNAGLVERGATAVEELDRLFPLPSSPPLPVDSPTRQLALDV